jgi:hypothetical protein
MGNAKTKKIRHSERSEESIFILFFIIYPAFFFLQLNSQPPHQYLVRGKLITQNFFYATVPLLNWKPA